MITVTIGNIYSSLAFPSRQRDNIGAALQQELSAEIPSARFTWAFKSGAWDGKVRLFDAEEDRFIFLTGLIPLVLTALRNSGFQVDQAFNDQRQIPSIGFNATTVPLRPFQTDGVNALLGQSIPPFGWWPRGILHVATGGGKTEMAVSVYEVNPRPTFFLVHRKDLLLQAKDRFKKYGLIPGVLGANIWTPDPNLNIATMQTVISILKREDDPRKADLECLMRGAHQVFFDEAHLMASTQDKGNQFVRVASLFERAYCRWGLTATPFMRDKYDNLLLQGVTGGVAYSILNSELIEEGWLTPAKVIMKTVPGTLPVTFDGNRKSNKAQAKYWRSVNDKGITFNAARNRMVVEEISKGPYPMLILVKTIEQGKFIQHLYDMAHPGSLKAPILTGKSSADQRRKAARDMNSGKMLFVIATTIFDEGVDIPQLRKVILASGGKSHVKLLQRAGRGLRIAEGKEEVIIVDFMDKHHALLLKHSKLRQKVWKEQGFELQIDK